MVRLDDPHPIEVCADPRAGGIDVAGLDQINF